MVTKIINVIVPELSLTNGSLSALIGLYRLSSKISHRNGRRGVLEPKVRDIRKTISVIILIISPTFLIKYY